MCPEAGRSDGERGGEASIPFVVERRQSSRDQTPPSPFQSPVDDEVHPFLTHPARDSLPRRLPRGVVRYPPPLVVEVGRRLRQCDVRGHRRISATILYALDTSPTSSAASSRRLDGRRASFSGTAARGARRRASRKSQRSRTGVACGRISALNRQIPCCSNAEQRLRAGREAITVVNPRGHEGCEGSKAPRCRGIAMPRQMRAGTATSRATGMHQTGLSLAAMRVVMRVNPRAIEDNPDPRWPRGRRGSGRAGLAGSRRLLRILIG